MKRYIVMKSYAYNGVSVSPYPVKDTSSIDKAKAFVKQERDAYYSDLATDSGLTVYDDTSTCFDIGEEGYYLSNFFRIEIVELESED